MTIKKPDLGAENAIGAWGQLALDGRDLWVLNRDRTLSRIDTSANRVASRFRVGDVGKVAVGDGAVWVGGFSRVFRVDPASSTVVEQIDLTTGIDGISGLAVGAGSAWATVEASGTVWQIDTTTNRIRRTIELGRGASSVVVVDETVWIGNAIDGRIIRIDAESGAIVEEVAIGRPVRGITATADTLWVGAGNPYYYSRGYYPTHIGGYFYYPYYYSYYRNHYRDPA